MGCKHALGGPPHAVVSAVCWQPRFVAHSATPIRKKVNQKCSFRLIELT